MRAAAAAARSARAHRAPKPFVAGAALLLLFLSLLLSAPAAYSSWSSSFSSFDQQISDSGAAGPHHSADAASTSTSSSSSLQLPGVVDAGATAAAASSADNDSPFSVDGGSSSSNSLRSLLTGNGYGNGGYGNGGNGNGNGGRTCPLTCAGLGSCIAVTCELLPLWGGGGSRLRVTLDVARCKGSALSWVCCAGPACQLAACNSASTPYGAAGGGLAVCGDALRASYLLPANATSVPLQVHDGALQGNRSCPSNANKGYGPGQCCAGSGSATNTNCAGAVSNTCDLVLQLRDYPGCVRAWSEA
ncbi:hypothetical protein HXX76_001042 [Chlamydomonas incerta]|uniref:Uncharacterized protein n=1 Tax=Chlamydomonas incerta TaxID=51695 RepID=A0A835WBJ9_CHLIN|nr:hypothetical protein HXX76_001042 [Chlamydomonas incerta]|eukprot:KAG2444285.1 hypothetical protein HXX76_001042 [Chlamydomonas incerta]